jgi:hypothetical protein
MSSATPGPRCPRCHRPIAAWRLPHCVYCGENFPPDLKEGHAEPEALKWVDRPAISPDAAKQLELMKYLPGEPKAAPRSRPVLVLGASSIVAFTIIVVVLFLIIRRSLPSAAGIVLVLGGGFLGYLSWVFLRLYRRGGR